MKGTPNFGLLPRDFPSKCCCPSVSQILQVTMFATTATIMAVVIINGP